jgi:hypothetical protein
MAIGYVSDIGGNLINVLFFVNGQGIYGIKTLINIGYFSKLRYGEQKPF